MLRAGGEGGDRREGWTKKVTVMVACIEIIVYGERVMGDDVSAVWGVTRERTGASVGAACDGEPLGDWGVGGQREDQM